MGIMRNYLKYSFLTYSLILLLATSCSAAPTNTSPYKDHLFPHLEKRPAESFLSTGEEYMVVSENKTASKIGAKILAQGGNAFDAAVAVSFALSVLRPQSTGLGGGGFFLLYESDLSKLQFLDARERAPAGFKSLPQTKRKRERNPGAFVGVPGLVKGLYEVHQKFGSGKISWAKLIEPSIGLAKNGFIIYHHLGSAIKVAAKEGVLDYSDEVRKMLGRGYGKIARPGMRFKNPSLAKLLAKIAQNGPDAFYKGELPRSIAKISRKYGGSISASDFSSYQLAYREPAKADYKNYQVVTAPLPSSAGLVLTQLFYFLDKLDVDSVDLHTLAELQSLAFEDRAKFLGDPNYSPVNLDKLTSQDYLDGKLKNFSEKKARKVKNLHKKTPIPTSTTHFSIVDKAGNIVSSTQSINHYFGSGLYAGGVFLNNTLDDFSYKNSPNEFGLLGEKPNYPEAGKTPLSSMSPTIVFRNKQPFLVLGSPGGPRIISAVFQTIVNRIHGDLDLFNSVARSRFHQQWQPNKFYLERNGFRDSAISKLQSMGHSVEETKYLVGNVSAIEISPDGKLFGVADPRRSGVPIGK